MMEKMPTAVFVVVRIYEQSPQILIWPGIILFMHPANERCYIVTTSLIEWAHTKKFSLYDA